MMKKKLKIIAIFLFLMLFFKIDVNAYQQGASLDEIKEIISNDNYTVAKNDEYCFFKSDNEEYIMILFSLDNKGDYVLSDVTSYFNDGYRQFHVDTSHSYVQNPGFVVQSDNISTIEENLNGVKVQQHVYKGSKSSIANLCSNLKTVQSMRIDGNYTTYLIDKTASVDTVNGNEGLVNIYSNMNKTKELSLIAIISDKKGDQQQNEIRCSFGISNANYFLKYDDDNGYYFSNGASTVCFARATGINNIRQDIILKSDKPNFESNFSCDNYFVSNVIQPNTLCTAYILPNEDKNLINDDFTSSSVESGSVIAIYINPTNRERIQIYKKENGLGVADLKNNLSDKFSGLNNWISNFENEDNYPKYIINSADKYVFLDSLDEISNYDDLYILLGILNTIGSDEIEKTCESIFGGTFVNFLQNTVLKFVYIAIPIILLVLTSIDFAKVVFIDDKEGIQNAVKRFGKRLVAAILIFLIPNILIFIVNIIGIDEVEECVKTLMDYSDTEINN